MRRLSECVWNKCVRGVSTALLSGLFAFGAAYAQTNTPPAVSLTAPANGASFTSPASIGLAATASDANGSVTRVRFYRGTTLLATDTTAPYSYNWTNVAPGTYSITARATDNQGVVTTSAPVSVTVVNTPPTVSLTSPANGASFTSPATVALAATAADSNGSIASVRFYRGTTLLATDTTAPYSYNWTNVAPGTYSITARATDNQGAVTTSAPVGVTVGAANTAPTVSFTAPAAGASFTAPATVAIAANAADADGTVTQVQFYNGATLLGTDTASPYSFNWTDAPAGTYSITAVVTDNLGATATSTPVSLTVSNPPPVVAITAPSAGVGFVAPANVTISVDAADANGAVAAVEFYSGAVLLGTDNTAPFSFTWTGVPAGTYTITARATDNLGASATSAPVGITITNPAPTVSLTAPLAGTSFTAPAFIEMSASAADANGTVQRVEFYEGSNLIGQDGDSPYSFIWTGVPSGNYSLTAKAIDNQGAETVSAPVAISVQSNPAQIIVQAPTDGATVTAGTVLDIVVSVAGAMTYPYSLVLTDGADAVRDEKIIDASTSSPYTFSVPLGSQVGTRSFGVEVWGEGNSVPRALFSVQVTAGNQPPQVNLITPENGASFTTSSNIRLEASAIDTDGSVSLVEFYNGADLLGSDSTQPYSFEWNSVPAGTYSLTARATDNQGAVTNSGGVSIQVGSGSGDGPKLSLTTQSGTLSFHESVGLKTLGVLFEIGVLDASVQNIQQVEVLKNGSLQGVATRPYPLQNRWDYQWADVRPPGSYDFIARGTDSEGRIFYSAPVTVTVLPAVEVDFKLRLPANLATSGQPMVSNAGAPIAFAIEAYPGDDRISSVLLELNDQPMGSMQKDAATLANGAGMWRFDWTSPAAGSYQVHASFTKSNGVVERYWLGRINVVAPSSVPEIQFISPESGNVTSAVNLPIVFELQGTAAAQIQGYPTLVIDGSVYSGNIPCRGKSYPEDRVRLCSLDYRMPAVGAHSLEVTANYLDVIEGVVKTLQKTLSINVVQAPTPLEILSPSFGSRHFAGTVVPVTVRAPAGQSFSRVEIFNKGRTKLGDAVQLAPGSTDWLFNWRAPARGEFVLVAIATDSQGATLVSAPVGVIVDSQYGGLISDLTLDVQPGDYSQGYYSRQAFVRFQVQTGYGSEVPSSVRYFADGVLIGSVIPTDGYIPPFEWTLPSASHPPMVWVEATDSSGFVHFSAFSELPRQWLGLSWPVRIVQPTGTQSTPPGMLDVVLDISEELGRVVRTSVGLRHADYWSQSQNYSVTFPGKNTLTEIPLTPGSGPWLLGAGVETEYGDSYSAMEDVSVSVAYPYARWLLPANYSAFAVGQSVDMQWQLENCNRCTVESVNYLSEHVDGYEYLIAPDLVSGDPFRATWNNPSIGRHILKVRPTVMGRPVLPLGESPTISVANNPPSVSITSPVAGATFAPGSTLSIAATAVDPDGGGRIANVSFFASGRLLGTRSIAPYVFNWFNAPEGSHVLTAVATDELGASGTSAPVAVAIVGNPRESITYIHTDLSGSPLVGTNAAGNVLWKENYSAFGSRQMQLPGTEGQRQWFHGKEVDAETGLQNFGARHYDAVLGRFISIDPVGFQEDNLHSFNRYAYGNNNPLRFVDPDGAYADIAIEALSLAVGLDSLRTNLRDGNYRAASVDGLGLIGDAILAAVPAAPGAFGLGIRASREGGQILSSGVQWTAHGGKHIATSKVPWANIVEGTKTGPAKYLPGTNIEALERRVWAEGTRVTNGKSWKVMEFSEDIGASAGKSSRWMRVEESSGVIHGHPISQSEFRKLTK